MAVGVNVFMAPALVTLLFKGALGFNVVIFPTVLTGTLKLLERDRRGVSLCYCLSMWMNYSPGIIIGQMS